MTGKRRIAAGFVALGLLTVAIVVWPKAPRFERYTSPRIIFYKDSFRLTALVPSGWEPVYEAYGRDGANEISTVALAPPPRFGWLPIRLRRALFGEPIITSRLFFDARPVHQKGSVRQTFNVVGMAYATPFTAFDSTSDGRASATLMSDDKAAFDRTRDVILKSVRIIPDG